MKKLILGLSIIIMLSIAVIITACFKVETINTTELNNAEGFDLLIEKGTSLYKLKRRLSQYAYIDELGFKLWVKLNGDKGHIKAGLYEVPQNAKLIDIIDMLNLGKVKQFSITLLEGETFKQWLALLQKTPTLKQDLGDVTTLYDKLINANTRFCANQYASLEGCLLPDTYFYTNNDSALMLLKRAYDAMHIAVNKAWDSRFLDIPLNNQYEAIILASIIEKETAIDSERSEIAGVFTNRLHKNMRLQTDPTVIYGAGEDYDGDITRKHLRTPTPYNTYVIKGLPITPIAMTGVKSLQAAVQPAITDAYYFVATGDGGHQFSATLEQHNKALRAYLDKLKQRRE